MAIDQNEWPIDIAVMFRYVSDTNRGFGPIYVRLFHRRPISYRVRRTTGPYTE
jgi:hypothetical protein